MVEEFHFGRRETGAAFLAATALGLAALSLLEPSARAQAMPGASGMPGGFATVGAPDILYGPGGPVAPTTALASLTPISGGRPSLPQRLEKPGANSPAEPATAVSRPPTGDFANPAAPLTPAIGPLKIGVPYRVNGVWYVPAHEPDYDEEVIASWYGEPFHGQRTANGEVYDQFAMTGAHPTLPLPSLVDVTNLENGRRVTVRLNDRGPFAAGRSLDLSQSAALALGMRERGTARTRVRYIGPATPQAGDERLIAAAYPRPADERRPMGQGTVQWRPSENGAQPPPAQTAGPAPLISAAPLDPPRTAPGGYFVQIGAFAAPANAERARSAVTAIGSVAIRPAVVNGVTLHRVVIGPWTSAQGAEAALVRLSAMGQGEARVVRMAPAP